MAWRRLGQEAAGSHRPSEEGRSPGQVAGKAAGWGCRWSPLRKIVILRLYLRDLLLGNVQQTSPNM